MYSDPLALRELFPNSSYKVSKLSILLILLHNFSASYGPNSESLKFICKDFN